LQRSTKMASNAFTSAGTTVAISASLPATYDAAGFGALTFTTIGEITDAGEYGKEYNLVTHNPLADRKTYKRKGSYNNGSMTLQMGRVPDDAGQVLLLSAQDSDNSYSFEVTLQDGTINYFTGQVMSYRTSIGSVDQITSASVTVEVDSDIVEV
jgi:hypothetical protein